MVKVIHLTPNMSRGQIHLVLGKYKVGEDDFAHVVAHLDSLEALAAEQARAEALAACIADVDAALAIFMENEGRSKDEKLLVGGTCLAIKNRLAQLQPAAADLEALLREAGLDKLHYCIKMCLLYEHEPDGFDSLITHLRADEEKARASEDK